jgi:hypothetical protein
MMPTPAERLVEAIGHDAAVSVLLVLTDIHEDHVLEVDDGPRSRLISPSVAWLIDSLTDGLLGKDHSRFIAAHIDGAEGAEAQ